MAMTEEGPRWRSPAEEQREEAGEEGPGGGEDLVCEECGVEEFKYKCPACGLRTCSLKCVKAHKERTGCTGVRDRTQYKPMDKLGDREMFSDISFLDDVKRVRDVARRSRPIPPRKENNLPHFMKTLRFQARKRGVRLLFLQPGMERRKENSTFYHRGKDRLYWRVQWRFDSVEGAFIDQRVDDTTILSEVLLDHLTLRKDAALEYHKLQAYTKAGLDKIKAYLPLHKQRVDQEEMAELDLGQSLAANLIGKTVVEFPIFCVRLQAESPAEAAGERSEGPAAK